MKFRITLDFISADDMPEALAIGNARLLAENITALSGINSKLELIRSRELFTRAADPDAPQPCPDCGVIGQHTHAPATETRN